MMGMVVRILLSGILLYYSYIETGLATAGCLFLIIIRLEMEEHFTEKIVRKIHGGPIG